VLLRWRRRHDSGGGTQRTQENVLVISVVVRPSADTRRYPYLYREDRIVYIPARRYGYLRVSALGRTTHRNDPRRSLAYAAFLGRYRAVYAQRSSTRGDFLLRGISTTSRSQRLAYVCTPLPGTRAPRYQDRHRRLDPPLQSRRPVSARMSPPWSPRSTATCKRATNDSAPA